MNVVQGNSPYQYSHTVLYKCHTAVAAVAITILAAFIVNLLWRVFAEVKQKKSWYSLLQLGYSRFFSEHLLMTNTACFMIP